MACDFKAIIANSRVIQTELAKLNSFEQIVALYSLTCQYAQSINPGISCDPKIRATANLGCLRCFSEVEILALNASLLCDSCGGGCVTPNIITTSLPGGVVGTAYSQRLLLNSGTGTWSIVAGSLPFGLSFNTATGDITGTPTSAGTFDFTVTITNSCGTDTQALQIVTAATCVAPTVTSAATANATVGGQFQFQSSATGSAPMTWTLASGTLPAGLEMDSATGLISGTVTAAAGSFPLTIRATNACGNNTKALTITVVSATIFWGNFQAPVPGTFTATQIKALPGRGGGSRVSTTRAGNYDFAANGPPPEHQVIWIPDALLPPTATGTLSITASGLAIPLNPAPNTPYQSLSVDGAAGKVFVTGNANGGGFNTAGGNPMVIA